jgi:uncharacterized OsmC-like protein
MTNIVKVSLKQEADFRFAIQFAEGMPVVYGDEPPPLGKASGPAPTHFLGAAVGNCLSASLLFALRKFKQNPDPIATEVDVVVDRNAENRLRVVRIDAKLTVGVPAGSLLHLDRVLAQFEEFCTVTQSIRQGIAVEVSVFDSTGAKLK